MKASEKFHFTLTSRNRTLRASYRDRRTVHPVNLRTLEYVVAVADLGHFSRAAERCKVSQPTLSLQIRSLETQLGLELFERSTHPVRLTPNGLRLIGPMRAATDEARKIGELAIQLRGGVAALATETS